MLPNECAPHHRRWLSRLRKFRSRPIRLPSPPVHRSARYWRLSEAFTSHFTLYAIDGRDIAGSSPTRPPVDLTMKPRLVIFERSGHFPFLEEPRAFRRAVTTWIAILPQ